LNILRCAFYLKSIMPKKLIDIYPPRKFDDFSLDEESIALPADSVRNERFARKTKKIWFGLPLLVISFLVLHFFFAEAHITVWPQITELHIQEQIAVQVGQQNVDLGQKLIPAKFFTQEKEATKSFASTGREERVEKAGGTIRVFNENASSQTLIANTRFISEDGKLFRSKNRVSIPAAQNGQPGSADLEVAAAESGNEYNIGPSNFSLPGLAGSALYTKVYGKSSVSMVGGAVGEVSVVTQEDIRNAKEQLIKDLEIEAKSALLSRIPPNFMILDGSMETDLLQDNSLVKEGAALDEFTYTASIEVSTLAFAKEDGRLLSRHMFESYLGSNEKIKEDTFHVAYSVEASNMSTGRMILGSDISAEQYVEVDLGEVHSRFRGVPKREIGVILEEFPTLARAEFSLWPFWIQHIPQDKKKFSAELSL
jgi:hypothetical protein